MTAADPWITVIGLGDDGLVGLSQKRIAEIKAADVLVGGERHMGHVPDFNGLRITWDKGFHPTFDRIEAECLGKRVVVLASGDPMYFGAGAGLCERFGMENVVVHPAPGAFSLAAARMGWSLPDCERLTVHGRAAETVLCYLQPGRRLLVLTQDGTTPALVANLLTDAGFGQSRMTVLAHLGGAQESRMDGLAETWAVAKTEDLNTLAIECVAGKDARIYSQLAGLPDDAFEHDGQLTKREVRAVTLSSLAPLAGEVLWDVGAGAGSIAIEWMRGAPHTRAVAFESDPARARRIEQNARTLGVPRLTVIEGTAPDAFPETTEKNMPDAIFIGGGVSDALLDAAWARLRPGGRLVSNAVTTAGEAALTSFCAQRGGSLTRIGIERLQAMGVNGAKAFRPARQVLHLCARKAKA